MKILGSDYIVDARAAYTRFLALAMAPSLAARMADALIPGQMAEFLASGPDAIQAARRALAYTVEQGFDVAALRSGLANGLLTAQADARLYPPVPDPGKILAIGSNFRLGAGKGKSRDQPGSGDEPLLFSKFASTLQAHGRPVPLLPGVKDLDCEGELVIVIGKACSNVGVGQALDYVAGFTIANDITRRAMVAEEKARGSILFSKNFPSSTPCGPYLTTSDAVNDIGDLCITTKINGEVRTKARVKGMIHAPAELVSICSRVGLHAGDLILSGSPKAGADTPPRYLAEGDVMSVDIDQLGTLESPVVSSARPIHI